MKRLRRGAAVFAVAAGMLTLLPGVGAAKPPTSFDPVVEAQNFSITQQRQAIYDTPQYQSQLATASATNTANALAAQAADPGRFFTNNLCWNGGNGCAGDIRLYNWGPSGYGIVRPVLFTARDGATLSGHVWATLAGPAKRPGIVITDGSVQADEWLYWYAAQALAKDGYVVLTFDPQGQGQSDTFGQGADSNEGVPSQSDGRPFYDGTEDALNFLLSSQAHPYEPVPSCTTGTSHAAQQNARVKQGFDAAYNPFWQMLDSSEIGLAGHSYGAAGVSYIAQWDPRVKAVVAWDNLGGPGPKAAPVPGSSGGSSTIGEASCPAAPADRTTVPVTKPGLGISADYGLPPSPNTSLPNPEGKSSISLAYSKAGVDTGEVIIKGGSHLDFSWIPNQAFGASLRGPDITDWYTSAWFDKYLKHDAGADARLLTNRWRVDPVEKGVDPNHDANAFSFYYYSRLDIHLNSGQAWRCEDLRVGCAGMAGDGFKGDYSYITLDTTHDRRTPCTTFGCPPASPPAHTSLSVSAPRQKCTQAFRRLAPRQSGVLRLSGSLRGSFAIADGRGTLISVTPRGGTYTVKAGGRVLARVKSVAGGLRVLRAAARRVELRSANGRLLITVAYDSPRGGRVVAKGRACSYAAAPTRSVGARGGQPVHARLYLLSSSGLPVAQAPVTISDGRRAYRVTSGADGSAPFTLPAGPNRAVNLGYLGAVGFDAAALQIKVVNRAWGSLRLSSHRLPARGRATFSGIATGPSGKPAALAVTLQYLTSRNRWRNVTTTRANRAGRWHAKVTWPRHGHAGLTQIYYRVVVAGNPSAQINARLP